MDFTDENVLDEVVSDKSPYIWLLTFLNLCEADVKEKIKYNHDGTSEQLS